MSDTKTTTSPRDATPQPFGPFVLQRRIAVGGTAEVFHARPRVGQRPASELVIKRLLANDAHSDHFALLSREAELHRAVQHENVVTVFGAGMVGQEPYLAMEFVDGVDLHRLLKLSAGEGRPLPPSCAVYVAHCVALALQAVHGARDESGRKLEITHGDVSPSNVYLSLDGQVKLGDFGVAHTASPNGGKSESVKGKFGYLAPEQLEGDAFDHRADIFALGVVLGEMLIGQKIFPGNGQLATLLSIREVNIEPLTRAAARLPAAVYEACARALAKDPVDRFADAGDFARSLQPLCDLAVDRKDLSERVRWARDESTFARSASQRLRGATAAGVDPGDPSATAPSGDETSSVRRGGLVIHEGIAFPLLVELAATGQLQLDDEVSLMGAAFRRVEEIEQLSRYLMPSTTTTTTQLFGPGVPDFTAELAETSMLHVLARMRRRRETGALFVTRKNRRGMPDRKDLYLSSGRLMHVASSDREELLGQYALRLKLITRAQLDEALDNLQAYGGRLGDTLIGMGMAEPTAVFRAIRNQGRDRVASLCSWREGRVQLYRGSEAAQVQFPLDLDLSVPMMAGAMILLRHGAHPLGSFERLHPGRRLDEARDGEDVDDAPRTLSRLLELVQPGVAAESLVNALRGDESTARSVSKLEARAAIVVAAVLEWVRAE